MSAKVKAFDISSTRRLTPIPCIANSIAKGDGERTKPEPTPRTRPPWPFATSRSTCSRSSRSSWSYIVWSYWARCCYLLFHYFPLCLDDEELSYTSDSVGSEACGMIAVLDCERWTEYQVVQRRCHLNLTLIRSNQGTPRATRSLIDRRIPPKLPDRTGFTPDAPDILPISFRR